MTDKPIFQVKEGRTLIRVSHQNENITFVAPYFGPAHYDEVGNQIDRAGLLRPTFAETVSLVYSAIENKDNKYAKQVLGILNDGYNFWGFNKIKYNPKVGVWISDRNRKNVHVPFELKTGKNSFNELVVLALAEGEEGVEKLVKITKSLKKKSYDWSFDLENVDSTEYNRVASLESHDRAIYCGRYCNCDGGCAYGILPKGR